MSSIYTYFAINRNIYVDFFFIKFEALNIVMNTKHSEFKYYYDETAKTIREGFRLNCNTYINIQSDHNTLYKAPVSR